MIQEFVHKILSEQEIPFDLVTEEKGFSFYQQLNGMQKRYLVITATNELLSPDGYNHQIMELAPDVLKESPAFEKNTDLLILLDIIDSSTEHFKKHEREIFLVEENPYFFKKYVLYTADEERKLLKSIQFSDFPALIRDRDKFEEYKSQPYNPSIYGVLAKIFIKLPFLKIPSSSIELNDLDELLKINLSNENLLDADNEIIDKFSNYKNLEELEKLVEDYLNE